MPILLLVSRPGCPQLLLVLILGLFVREGSPNSIERFPTVKTEKGFIRIENKMQVSVEFSLDI